MKYFIIDVLLYLTIYCTFCDGANNTNISTNRTTPYYKIRTTTEPYSLLKPSLKKNLILYGLDKIERDTYHLKRLVYDLLVVEAKVSELQFIDIAIVYRLEPKQRSIKDENRNEKTPILIKFRTEAIRDIVFTHRHQFNTTSYRLDIDRSKRARHKANDLNPLKKKILEFGIDCKVYNGKLFVNGRECSSEEINRFLDKAKLKTTSSSLKPGFVIRTRASLTWKK